MKRNNVKNDKNKTFVKRSLYREDMVERAFRLCLLGLKNEDLAIAFGVCPDTIGNWEKEHPEFGLAVQRGRQEADGHIAASLYQRAKGYSHPDVYMSSYRGLVTTIPIIKHYPPDTMAAIYWLNNRQAFYWKHRQEHTGKDGGPIQHEHEHKVMLNELDLSDFTDEELKLILKAGKKLNVATKQSDSEK